MDAGDRVKHEQDRVDLLARRQGFAWWWVAARFDRLGKQLEAVSTKGAWPAASMQLQPKSFHLALR